MNANALLDERLSNAVAACQALAKSGLIFSEDKQTDQFCRGYLTHHLNRSALQAKVAKELKDKHYLPLGRLLFIISENDVLGTTLGFLAAYITGNQMIVKARQSQPVLQFLKEQLALSDAQVLMQDWQGGEQDDQALLSTVDGVVLAGGEQLITHFRQRAPYPIRLIEFGPKLSAVAIGDELPVDIKGTAHKLAFEVSLFLQCVCTSPRFIMVESKQTATLLFQALNKLLPSLPVQDQNTRLVERSTFETLSLLQRVDASLQAVAFSEQTGWGITLAMQLNPDLWCGKGFNLIVGNTNSLLQEAQKKWPNRLQTLAVEGYKTFSAQLFTRFCPLGTMHYRPLTAPHDGFFELGALVSFISKEVL